MRWLFFILIVVLAVAYFYGDRMLGLSVKLSNYCLVDEDCTVVRSGPPDICGALINRKEEQKTRQLTDFVVKLDSVFKKKALSPCGANRGPGPVLVCESGRCDAPISQVP